MSSHLVCWIERQLGGGSYWWRHWLRCSGNCRCFFFAKKKTPKQNRILEISESRQWKLIRRGYSSVCRCHSEWAHIRNNVSLSVWSPVWTHALLLSTAAPSQRFASLCMHVQWQGRNLPVISYQVCQFPTAFVWHIIDFSWNIIWGQWICCIIRAVILSCILRTISGECNHQWAVCS